MSLNSVWNVSNVLNVVAFNDSPTITVNDGEAADGTPVTSTVDENTAGALLGAITVRDANQILTAAHITTSDARFVVVTDAQGNLWLALADGVSLDYESEASVDVTLTVTDDEGSTAQTTVTITVHDINEAPNAPNVTPAASNLAVEENTPFGMNLALLSSADPEGDDVTYQVDNANFEIEVIGSVAILRLKNGASPDREATADGTITLNVTATDADGNVSDSTEVVVTILDVNEPPTGDDTMGTVTAGASTPATGNVNASDVDEGDTLTYLVGDAATYGTLVVNTNGAWTYTLDETDAAVIALAEGVTLEDTATIVISDNNGGTATVDVTITITGANEDPTGDDGSGAIMVGGDPVAGNVNATDVDEGDTHSFSVSTAPSYGRITVNREGTWTYRLDQTNSAVIALADGATLEDTATIVITDSSGGTASVDVTITITGVNNPPTGEDSTGEVTAGGGPIIGEVNASDADTLDTLSYAVGTAATYGTLAVGTSGTWSYELDNTNDAVIALSQGATLQDTATIVITDSAGAMDTVDVTITITGVNDAPTGEDASGAVLRGGDADTGSLTSSDVDTGDTLSFSVGTAPEYGTLEIDTSGNWTYTLDEEHESVTGLADDATLADEAIINVTDSSGGSSTLTLSITIYATNDAPSITVADGTTSDGTSAQSTINENAPGVLLGSITVSDPDQALDAGHVSTSDARFVVTTDDAGDLFLALADGVSLDHEAEPTVDVTVTVTDDLDTSADARVTITVNNQNDPPDAPTVRPSASNFMVRENDTTGDNLADLTSTDPEGDDPITFHVDHQDFEIERVGSASLLKVKDGVALDHEASEDGTITINVTAPDPSGAVSDPTPVVITVVDVNESPAIVVADTTFSLDENTSGRLRSLTVSDPEQTFAADDITLSDARFSIETDESGTLWLTLSEGLDAEMEQSVTLTLEVTDDGGLEASTEVTINIVEVNEAPTLTVTDATRPDGLPARSLISENDTGPVGLITITDPEDDLDASNITLSSTRFATETDAQGNIWLMLSDAADYEADGNSLSVTITVTDTEGLSTELDFDLGVVDVNEAPTISVADGETVDGTLARSTIVENTTGYVGAITVTDPEQTLGADDITVNDDRFSIQTDAFGGIWLVLDEAVDADTEAMVTVELQVVDSSGLAATTEVNITITGVNESPSVTVRDATRSDGARARSVIDENETGAIGLITLADPEETLDASNITLSSTRFATETDAQGRIWLLLDDAADYETDGGILSVTVTVTDTDGLSSETDVRLRVVNVNDAPESNQDGVLVITQEATDEESKEVEAAVDLFATAGTGVVQMKLDLGEMFSDQDGDSIFRYHLENAPDWFELINVQYGQDGSVTGELVGTVPAGSDTSAFDVRLVATDQGGASGSTEFNVIVDDGNDSITAWNLINADGTENDFKTVEIAENDASGVVLGTLTAEDQDDPRHPNGRHTFEVAPEFQAQFEAVRQGEDWVLKVKDGVALDFEAANTINLEVIAKDGGGSSLARTVTVNVTDNNDRPTVKNEPGNWWVTVDEDLDADDVTAGEWLSFSLETGDDALALFEEVDEDDSLTYSIVSGPSWLEIDATTGALQNKEEMIPTRGIYNVTVRATDESNATAQASFQIAVVLSDEGNADNSEPDIESDGVDIMENARPGAVVATITIEDEDLDVAPIHPWGDLTIVVSAMADVGDQTDVVIQSAADFMDDDSTNDFFELVRVSGDSDSVTYNIVLTEAAFEGPNAINAESYSEVEITVTAYDGTVTLAFDQINNNTDGADIDDFDFEIEDVNEAPTLVATELDAAHTSAPLAEVDDTYVYPVEQQHAADTDSSVHSIYLNLSKLFEDPDEDHDDGDFSFTASISNTLWLKMARHWNEDEERYTTGAVKWEDIKDGLDEDDMTDDDVPWGTGTEPDDDDYVLILEVDRTGNDPVDGGNPMPDSAEIGQDVNGLITIVATDEDGARSTTSISVTITDENLNPRADGSEAVGVRISDTTPHEKDTINLTFDESVDPDFTGSGGGDPIVVIHQVINVEGGGSGTETIVQATVGDTASYTVKQTDVGDEIQGKVVYFELFNGNIVPSQVDNAALETNSELVADRQDAATITFSFATNASDQLVATTSAQDTWDPDGIPVGATITYTWEYSSNGRGGWTEFDADGADTDPDLPDTTMATIPSSVSGNFVRLVVTFTDNGGVSETVVSDAVKVGTIDTLDAVDVPAIDAGGQTGDVPVGRILRIDLADATPMGGTASAEWLAGDEVVGTGTQYRVTDDDRGKAISVRITSRDDQGDVTSIVTTAGLQTVAAPVNSGPISPEDTHTIDLGAAPVEEGQLASHSATVPMASLFEDVEGGLTFDFAAPTNFGPDGIEGDATLDVYHDVNTTDGEGDQLLILDEATGAVNYYTTMSHGHDDNDADGGGNLIISELTANDAAADGGNGATATINVQFRIDVAPTGFEVGGTLAGVAPADSSYDFAADGATLTEEMLVTADAQGMQENPQVAAEIDVQDENMVGHDYGKYTFTVSDNRFEVVPSDTDGSMGTLRLKTGHKLDYEAENADGNPTILLVVTAMPVSGNFDPISIGITVTVANETGDDPPAATPDLGNNMVPGLKDDETGADDDDTTDDTTDDDEDGGTPEPMNAFFTTLDDGMFL